MDCAGGVHMWVWMGGCSAGQVVARLREQAAQHVVAQAPGPCSQVLEGGWRAAAKALSTRMCTDVVGQPRQTSESQALGWRQEQKVPPRKPEQRLAPAAWPPAPELLDGGGGELVEDHDWAMATAQHDVGEENVLAPVAN